MPRAQSKGRAPTHRGSRLLIQIVKTELSEVIKTQAPGVRKVFAKSSRNMKLSLILLAALPLSMAAGAFRLESPQEFQQLHPSIVNKLTPSVAEQVQQVTKVCCVYSIVHNHASPTSPHARSTPLMMT